MQSNIPKMVSYFEVAKMRRFQGIHDEITVKPWRNHRSKRQRKQMDARLTAPRPSVVLAKRFRQSGE
jgi:hypothetical protein